MATSMEAFRVVGGLSLPPLPALPQNMVSPVGNIKNDFKKQIVISAGDSFSD